MLLRIHDQSELQNPADRQISIKAQVQKMSMTMDT